MVSYGVAHPAMKKPIDFTNQETVNRESERLMTKVGSHMSAGRSSFGVFVDDMNHSAAASSPAICRRISSIRCRKGELYETYNQGVELPRGTYDKNPCSSHRPGIPQ